MGIDKGRGRLVVNYAVLLLFMLVLLLCSAVPAHAEDNELSYDRTLGNPEITEDNLSKPMDVAVDSEGNAYIADTYNNRIIKYKEDGGFESWGGPDSGSADAQFARPTGVALMPGGRIYVVDSGNNRVQVFDKDGIHQFNIGGYGAEEGKFNNPQGIAIDGSGALYVTDQGNRRVQKLLADGTPVWSTADNDGQFEYPVGIAISLDGKVFVADILKDRIRVMTGDGDYLDDEGWGSSGSGDNQFDMPYGLAFDQNNRLYVADRKNNRVKRFSVSGTFMDEWDSTKVGDGGEDVFRPQGLEVSNAGELYVLDDYYSVLHVFKPVPVAANLMALSVDKGELHPDFNASVLLYQVSVTHDVYSIRFTPSPLEDGATVMVDDKPVASGQLSEPIGLPVGMKPIEVKVSSQDGLVHKTYTVQVVRPKSDNARLLTVMADKGRWNMDFDPDKIAYTLTVDHEVAEISLTPVADNPYATIKVDGKVYDSGMPIRVASLSVGSDNYFEIKVEAQNPIFTRQYRFQIWRLESSDNNLSDLTTSRGSLSPAFDSDITGYTVTVPYETETIYAAATTEEPGATAVFFYENEDEVQLAVDAAHPLPLTVGDNNWLFIGVTAPNGWYQLYSIRVNRQPSNQAVLSALGIDHGSLGPAGFDPSTTQYSIEVGNDVEEIQLTPKVGGAGMTVKVAGNEVASGHASQALTLSVGTNTFEVVVTAMDGQTSVTYNVAVIRGRSPDAKLVDLGVDRSVLSPEFDADTLVYSVVVEHEADRISFTADTSEPHATVAVIGAQAAVNGTPSVFPVALDVGKNQVDIVVTAQDKISVRTYKVMVVRMLPGASGLEPAGTETNPYMIADKADLDLIRFDLDGYYRLTADLDMTGIEWTPVGSVTEPFSGGLDGGGHTVTGLVVDQAEADDVGLFAAISGDDHKVDIKNLTLTDARITGKDNVGLIAGYMMNAALENVYVKRASIHGGSMLGGFAGLAGKVTVRTSYAADTDISGESLAGGMFGQMQEMTIDQCYTSGSVSAAFFFAGGLSASSVSQNTITNVYSTSSVSGTGWMGGLIGFPTNDGDADAIEITNSYAIGSVSKSEMFNTGGLAAETLLVAAEHSYWVEELTGQATSAMGTVRTAAEMRRLDQEGNWDFADIWVYTPTGEYPQLQAFLSKNAALKDLQMDSGGLPLQPVFDPVVTAYTATVTSDVYEVTVKPALADETAQVTIDGAAVASGERVRVELAAGLNPIEIAVTAEDGETKRTYTITVNRQLSNNARLSSLQLNGGDLQLQPAFNPGITMYMLTVANDVNEISVTPTSEDSSANVQVNGLPVNVGAPFLRIPLTVGSNSIEIEVKGQDGSELTYTVLVNRGAEKDAVLSGLMLSTGILAPEFDPERTEYRVTVTYDVYELAVTPRLSDTTAQVRVQGMILSNGAVSAPISLNVGENTIVVQVMAADREVVRTYSIRILRENAPQWEGQEGETDGQEGATDGQEGDRDGQEGATDGQEGDRDGQEGATDGQEGDTDGQEGATDGQEGDTDEQEGDTDGQEGDTDEQEGDIEVGGNPGRQDSRPGEQPDAQSDVQPTAAGGDGFKIIVNGEQSEELASRSLTKEDGKTVARFHLIENQLQAMLLKEDDGIRITFPVLDGTDTVIGVFTGKDIKQLEQKEAILEIITDTASYTLPAREINIDEVSREMGEAIEPEDIRVTIELETANDEELAKLEQQAQSEGFSVVASPVHFRIQASHEDRKVGIKQFNSFVERSIRLKEVTNSNAATTGVIVGPDGSLRHVPTKVLLIDGIWYAQIRSLTNSLYAVIYNKRTFADMKGHWAEDAVTELASSQIIHGMDANKYAPGRAVTRAEFAAILQRAMGLADGAAGSPYTDVGDGDWFSVAVAHMHEYGIIQGYSDGSFRPDYTISREDAMVMTARAMRLARQGLMDRTPDEDAVKAYSDIAKISGYARQAVAWNVELGIVQGDGGLLRPDAPITRAQAAVIVLRLLQKMDLI
jgi:sugar lactone lactonase YvrE